MEEVRSLNNIFFWKTGCIAAKGCYSSNNADGQFQNKSIARSTQSIKGISSSKKNTTGIPVGIVGKGSKKALLNPWSTISKTHIYIYDTHIYI